MKKCALMLLISALSVSFAKADLPYETTIPTENHLDYFDLHGPVKEVKTYDYGQHGKTIWRFDQQGRLIEFLNYATPFAGNGGCVFEMTDHYRYAYDDKGAVTVLEAFNNVESLDDANDDKILTLFPTRAPKDTLFKYAEKEFGDTTYCYSRWWDGDPQMYFGRTYDKFGNMIEEFYGTAGCSDHTDAVVRDITYYDAPRQSSVPVGDMLILPDDVTEDKAFYLCFDYMGYAFEGSLYPLHNGWWIVLSHWCLDEEETIFVEEEDEPVPAASKYKDPFAGLKYPIIKTDSIGFMTRNYGGETIKLYSTSDGKKVWDKLKVECHLEVLDADVETRRVLCRTNPSHWSWEGQQFYSVYGWMDEEWVCANLLTTCP